MRNTILISVLTFAAFLFAGCNNAILPDEGGFSCIPGEERNPADCNPACDDGTTHMVCASGGMSELCALRPGAVCESTPPGPCDSDPDHDLIGTRCTECGVGGWYACVNSDVICVPDTAPVEMCNDTVDNDCDGQVNEGCVPECTPSPETCDNFDNDCDDRVDEECDDDSDGYCDAGMVLAPGGSDECPRGGNDCVDTNFGINPGAPEVCDGVDNDCDGLRDEGVTNACGMCGPTPAENCSDTVDNDCDGVVNDGCPPVCTPVTEVCDGRDNDCDGIVDDGVRNACGDCGPTPVENCSDTVDNDCDGVVNDGCCVATPEVCNDLDDDCDGFIDDGNICPTPCEENLGGAWTIQPSASLRASCPRPAVIVAWGPSGSEFRSPAGATSYTIPMSATWRGWAVHTYFCPDAGVDGTVIGEWRGSTTNWSSLLGRTLREAGFVETIDSTDISDAGRVCTARATGAIQPHAPMDSCVAFACP